MPAWLESLSDDLRAWTDAGLRREPPVLQGSTGPRVRVGGRELVQFSSNDYLSLASHPRLLAALPGKSVGAGASRLVTGTSAEHVSLEQSLAAFHGVESTLLFPAGYQANVSAIPALVGPEDAVFSDALNHASLVDGCRLSRARIHVVRHRDPDHLAELLSHERGARRRLIVTDSLFSMDGVLAPVRDLRRLADAHDAGLYVDEAHAVGVLGPRGAGLCAAEGVIPDVLLGAFGKAFGGAGAYLAGSSVLADVLLHRARGFVFSTGLALPLVRAGHAALELVTGLEGQERRARLLERTAQLRHGLQALGLAVTSAPDSPIVPLTLGDPHAAMRASARLRELGYLVQGIRPPTVPTGTSRLRIGVTADHSPDDIAGLLVALPSALRPT